MSFNRGWDQNGFNPTAAAAAGVSSVVNAARRLGGRKSNEIDSREEQDDEEEEEEEEEDDDEDEEELNFGDEFHQVSPSPKCYSPINSNKQSCRLKTKHLSRILKKLYQK